MTTSLSLSFPAVKWMEIPVHAFWFSGLPRELDEFMCASIVPAAGSQWPGWARSFPPCRSWEAFWQRFWAKQIVDDLFGSFPM